MNETATSVTRERKFSCQFSICSIITSPDEYGLMKQSFIHRGFSHGTEFLFADNSRGNAFDAYSAINRFMQEAQGEYLIITHQDIRCVDSANQLITSLNDLQRRDPTWAVCGNAGSQGYKNSFYSIIDNGSRRRSADLPVKVFSLDENLLIVKNACNLALSADIKDFHFYGTDICIIADFLGYSCYVIDFMVEHLSSGNLPAMHAARPAFVKKYGRKLRSRFMQTTCTKFYLGNSVARNRILNSGFVFFWIKAANRLANMFTKGE